MTVNIRIVDAQLGVKDLDDEYVTDAWLIDQHVGNALFGWGRNAGGTIGIGNTIDYSSPMQVDNSVNWKQVSGATGATLAVKTDGTLWAWGQNTYGELGQGNSTSLSTPLKVGSLNNWQQVNVGGGFVGAIKTDGTLWMWGYGGFGQIGIGNTISYSSPVQVGSVVPWRQVSCGQNSTSAIKSDGTLWTWGNNNIGQLGDGTVTNRSLPVQIGLGTTWQQVVCGYGIVSADGEHNVAITTDGKLWAWGYNNNGQLGLGDTSNRTTPVQVGTLTNWKRISDDHGRSTFAIKTDGTLWSWGLNTSGQLGIGNRINYNSPVQVGALTNWKQISNKGETVMGIKTDGTLWGWGNNSSGQLGIGNTVSYSSPIQVGSLTFWKQVNCNKITIEFGFNASRDSTLAITYREI
jgi:alpha-tubulin suppressor-like RCC1 family protein